MIKQLAAALAFVTIAGAARLAGQATASFDVVSIKRSSPDARGSASRTTPDGTTILTNVPIEAVFRRGTTGPVNEIENLPEWARDRYDVMVKPPAGAPRAALPEMWQTMLADRLTMRAHVEQREQDGFALVLARDDRRLGPNLKPSTLDCTLPPQRASPPPSSLPTRLEAAGRCGMLGGQGFFVSGGMSMSRLASLLSGSLGGRVTDRTALSGFYALELNFSRERPTAQAGPPDPAAPPNILTALQEQLGLRALPERATVSVLVIDHIEPPTEN